MNSGCLPERGEAIEWERRIAEAAPREAATLASEGGPGMLALTDDARRAAERYWSRLPRAGSPYAQLEKLRRLNRDAATTATRLAEWPEVQRLQGTEDLYEPACLCVLGREGEVEGRQASFRLVAGREGGGRGLLVPDPLSPAGRQLCLRVLFLVDRLVDEWNGKEGPGVNLSPNS